MTRTNARILNRIIVVAATLAPASALANFSGFDEFAGGSGSWTTGPTSGGGLFTVANGTLNFTTPSTSNNEQANRSWIASVGDYDADWSLRMDVVLGDFVMTGTQYATAQLTVGHQGDGQDYARINLSRYGASVRTFYADSIVNGSTVRAIFGPTTASSVAIGLSYNSASRVITAGYDADGSTGGYLFAPLQSTDVDAASTSWQMTAADHFVGRIVAQSEMPIALGQVTIDNFAAAPLQLPFYSPGDFDRDRNVDGDDFLLWQRGSGFADGNRDGVVNGQDLALWRGLFGSVATTAAASAAPEPATVALLAIPAALLCRRRRARIALAAMIFVAAQAIASSAAQANQVAYSWTGTIKKNPGAATDPWNVGTSEKPYRITLFVDQNAAERHISNLLLPIAIHNPTAVVFVVDGVTATTTVPDYIVFDDNLFGTMDQISAGFSAEINGAHTEILAPLRLHPSTFTLSQFDEAPPVFGGALTSEIAGGSVGNEPYSAFSAQGTLVITPVSIAPGDYDRDARVDGDDFLVWQRTLGSTTNFFADGDHDGAINGQDLAVWKGFFGTTANTPLAPVPEPTSLALLMLAALCLRPKRGCRCVHPGLLTMTLAGALQAPTAQASQIAYSWSGTITPNRSGPGADPWAVGAGETPFSISVFVDPTAAEQLDNATDIPFARFTPSVIGLSIGGVAATRTRGVYLYFFDGTAPGGNEDSVGVFFEAEFHGKISAAFTAVSLPLWTFSLALPNESPPIFGGALQTGATQGFTELYRTTTAAEPLVKTAVSMAFGDYDGDLRVDGDDFLLWQRTVGSTTDFAADANHDGAVNGHDLSVWKGFYGSTASTPVTPAPEPTSLALAAVAMLGLRSRRGRARTSR